MNNTRILIVEDDFACLIRLEMMFEKLGYKNIHKAESGEEALEKIEIKSPDLILMDIKLKGELSGIETAQKIQNRNIPIIYLTAYTTSETFEQAKNTLPYAYLNKPFDEIILKRSIELALAHASAKVSSFNNMEGDTAIFIKKGYKLEKVKFKDILWVESSGNYCTLFTPNGRYAMKISLKKLTQKLPVGQFIRTHRSILMQIDKIEKIDLVQNQIHIAEKSLPIGRSFRKELLERIGSKF